MYNKVFSLTAALIFVASFSFAQKGFHAGANFGVNAVGLYDYPKGGDIDGYKYETKLGSTFGLAGGYNFNDHWGANIEVNDANLGSYYKFHMDGQPDYTQDIDLNYVQIPVMVKFSGGNYRSRFSSMLGPQFSILTSAEMNKSRDISSSFKSNDFGILLTSGGDITLVEDLYLNAEIRLYYGFTSINSNPYAIFNPELGTEKLHSMYGGVNIGLHYLFRDPSLRPQRAY